MQYFRQMSNISDRIAQIIRCAGVSTRAFEQQLGCSNGVISKCINKGTDISSQWVSRIIDIYPNVNPSWLLTGEGDMLIEDTDSVKYNTGINGDNNKNNSVNDSGTLHRLLTLLESKDKQIEEKDKQISTLLNIVQDAKK